MVSYAFERWFGYLINNVSDYGLAPEINLDGRDGHKLMSDGPNEGQIELDKFNLQF